MIDSHCHLDHEPIYSNINDVIKRCKEVGLEKSIGIHPHESSSEIMEEDFIINEFQKYDKIIGVGETGLDFFYENSDRNSQVKSFIQHIEASIKLNCPLIIHSRDAEDKTFEILNQYKKKNLKILMHCFTGSKIFSEKLLDLNAYFSASGIITFNNSKELCETFKNLPESRILVETDSPFLSPVPMRGKKNEPSYIKYTLAKLAQIKNIDILKMKKITTANFNKIFFA